MVVVELIEKSESFDPDSVNDSSISGQLQGGFGLLSVIFKTPGQMVVFSNTICQRILFWFETYIEKYPQINF